MTENGLIPDVEGYLDEIAHWGGSPVVNLTKIPDNVWRTWSFRMKSDVHLADLKKEGRWLGFVYWWTVSRVMLWGYRHAPESVILAIRKRRVYY